MRLKIQYLIVTMLTFSIFSPQPAEALTNTSWDSKTVLKGEVLIAKGETVTVAPNTKIKVAPGTKITVLGTLLATSGLTLTGKSWTGLNVKGVANLKNFSLTGASTPFYVESTGSLTINQGKFSNLAGASNVEGKFVANGITYEKPAGNGINSNNPSASIFIENSTFTSSVKNNGDFFGLSAAKTFSLTNSSITGVHCALHVQGVTNMKLDKDTISGNVYGFMMYGSSLEGKKTITNTIIKNNEYGIDEGSAKNKNGTIFISNSTIKDNGKDLQIFTGAIKVKK
jgi:hypothetical protein